MNEKFVRPSTIASCRSRSESGVSRSSEPENTVVGGRPASDPEAIVFAAFVGADPTDETDDSWWDADESPVGTPHPERSPTGAVLDNALAPSRLVRKSTWR